MLSNLWNPGRAGGWVEADLEGYVGAITSLPNNR